MKFIPRYNDGHLVQHADDQIEDGTPIVGHAHEVPGFPIGNAIESYQGYLTVEVFKEQGRWNTETQEFEAGVFLDDTDKTFVPGETDWGLEVLYSERLMETLKIITWEPLLRGLVHLVFRLRVAWGSSIYKDVDFYVYVSIHEDCGELGA